MKSGLCGQNSRFYAVHAAAPAFFRHFLPLQIKFALQIRHIDHTEFGIARNLSAVVIRGKIAKRQHPVFQNAVQCRISEILVFVCQRRNFKVSVQIKRFVKIIIDFALVQKRTGNKSGILGFAGAEINLILLTRRIIVKKALQFKLVNVHPSRNVRTSQAAVNSQLAFKIVGTDKGIQTGKPEFVGGSRNFGRQRKNPQRKGLGLVVKVKIVNQLNKIRCLQINLSRKNPLPVLLSGLPAINEINVFQTRDRLHCHKFRTAG